MLTASLRSSGSLSLLALLVSLPAAGQDPCVSFTVVPGAAAPGDRVGDEVHVFDDVLAVRTSPAVRTLTLFERALGGAWNEAQTFERPSTSSIASHEPDTLGMAPGEIAWGLPFESGVGRVQTYTRDASGAFVESQLLAPVHPAAFQFGGTVALGEEHLVVRQITSQSAPDGWALIAYRRQVGTGDWVRVQRLGDPTGTPVQTSRFGWAVDLDGDRMAVGAPLAEVQGAAAGAVVLYEYDPTAGQWVLAQTLSSPVGVASFGHAVALDGDELVVGAPDASGLAGPDDRGAAFVYVRDPQGGAWSQAQTLTALDPLPSGPCTSMGPGGQVIVESSFADDVELSEGTLVVAQREWFCTGRVVVFRRQPGGGYSADWTTTAGTVQEQLGWDLAYDGGRLAIGVNQDDAGGPGHGTGFVLTHDWGPGDCDDDGIPDLCEVLSGTIDRNEDEIPDPCQLVGTPYCGPAVMNSTGERARLTGLGSAVAAEDRLDLCGEHLPQGQFGYLLASSATAYVPMAGGSVGNLCLSAMDFGRYTDQVQVPNSLGISCVDIFFGSIPTGHGPVALTVGDTWYFQYWLRDGNTSNFTAGLEVTLR